MNQKEWYMKILNWAETDSRLNLKYMDMVVLAEHLANEERGLTKRAVDVWWAGVLIGRVSTTTRSKRKPLGRYLMAKQKHEISEVEDIHTLLNMWLKTLDKEESYWDGVCASDCQIAYRFTVKDENSFINWLSANWENLPNKACARRGAGGESESQNPVAPRG